MIRFGPAGNSDLFYEQGCKHTYEAPQWLSKMGLTAFEYSFGRGVRITEKTAAQIRGEAEKNGVMMSVHAPYYVNFAGEGEDKYEKNLMYIEESAKAVTLLGGSRVIFHPGACGKMQRETAFKNTFDSFKRAVAELAEKGLGDVIYCPETMGKVNQIGTLEEVARLCSIADNVYPTMDFGHLHARGIGAINTKEDFESIINYLFDTIGSEKTKNMHVHFSHIEYTGMGEKTHRTFADEGFGPDHRLLCELFAEKGMTPTVICESKGTQAIDAKAMLDAYNSFI